jgi:hypothetical protein
MAIRIDGLPTGPVYVENAAQESTLQELLRVMASQSSRQRRYDAETAAASRRTADAANEAAASMSGVASATRSAANSTASGWSKMESGLNAAAIAAEDFKNSRFSFELQRLSAAVADMSITWIKSAKSIQDNPIAATASLFSTGIDSLSTVMKGLVTASGDVLKSFGPLGEALGGIAKTLGEVGVTIVSTGLKVANEILSKELQETVQNMGTFNKMGASFSGSFMELREVASRSGMTIEQFTKSMAAAEASVRQFGIPFAEGAKKVSDASAAMETIFDSNGRSIRNQLRSLGYSIEEQAELAADYMAQAKATMTVEQFKNLQAADVARATKAYAIDLKVLQDITGKNAKAAMEEARTKSLQAEIMSKFTDPKQAEKFQKYFATLPENAKKGFLQYIASGGQVVTDEVAALLSANNEDYARIFTRGRDIIYDSSKNAADAFEAGVDQTMRAAKKQEQIERETGGVIGQIRTLSGGLGGIAGGIDEMLVLAQKDPEAFKRSAKAALDQAGAQNDLTNGVLTAQEKTQKFAKAIEDLALTALPNYATAIGNAATAFTASVAQTLSLLFGTDVEKPDGTRGPVKDFEQYKSNILDIIRQWTLQTFPNLGELSARAYGGPVTSLVPYLVGERGPEVRTFDAPGQIIPLDQYAKNLDPTELLAKTNQMQNIFANSLDTLQKDIARRRDTAMPDTASIAELPTAVSRAIETAFASPSGLNQLVTELKTQLAADSQNNKRALEIQTQEIQKLVEAMNDNVAIGERIANNTA